MVMSIRLDPALRALLRRIARKSGRTESDVVREALLRFAAESRDASSASKPYERVAHLIGCVRGGPPDLSERTGRRFSDKLRRAKARRP